MKLNRRRFLQFMGLSTGSCLIGTSKKALAKDSDLGGKSSSQCGMLIDTTKCLGCRTCEMVCAETNDLPPVENMGEDVFQQPRNTSTTQYTVVNQFKTAKHGEIFVKKQCMHCDQPACASACLVKAMYKTKEGPVIWRSDRCMGCRYCMIACPFDVPKFEYGSNVPRIRKCISCYDRVKDGKQPACAENCPGGAIIFGKKDELLEEAKTRIYQNPTEYEHYIYGEREVGGTGIIYLAKAPFQELGFRMNLGTVAYPELTKTFLYSVPLVLILGPSLLLGIKKAVGEKNNDETK